MSQIENVVIIGSGPAGYTAAIYAARAGLNPLLLAGPEPGGQLVTTTLVENYPGFAEGIQAFDLIEAWSKQAKHFGTRVKHASVQSVEFQQLPNNPHTLYLEGNESIKALSVIVATGAAAKWLGVPGEAEYKNKGISACATCDGFAFRGKNVAVIGGGDAAFEEALYLSNLCSKVYIMHRRSEFRASKIMVERAIDAPNTYFVLDAVVESFYGSKDQSKLEGIVYSQSSQSSQLKVDGAFVAIGHTPNTKFLQDQVACDSSGYIMTKPATSTNVYFSDDYKINSNLYYYSSPAEYPYRAIPGVFAAGDCVDHVYRQAITAAGEGCKAALDAERYLSSLK